MFMTNAPPRHRSARRSPVLLVRRTVGGGTGLEAEHEVCVVQNRRALLATSQKLAEALLLSKWQGNPHRTSMPVRLTTAASTPYRASFKATTERRSGLHSALFW